MRILKQRFEELYTPQAVSKNIVLSVNVSGDKDGVRLQQNKLMQIAGNLISNAIKFTPRSGRVAVNMVLPEKEKRLTITVQDSGHGLSKEEITKLLAPDTESTDGTEGEKGYGFGLALVKHLIKGLNGTFDISSEEGVGSTFTVSLPFTD